MPCFGKADTGCPLENASDFYIGGSHGLLPFLANADTVIFALGNGAGGGAERPEFHLAPEAGILATVVGKSSR